MSAAPSKKRPASRCPASSTSTACVASGSIHFLPSGASTLFHKQGGLGSCRDPIDTHICHAVADQGLISVAVEVRNLYGKLGPYPYPASPNDVISTLDYLHANKAALAISKIVLFGYSFGACINNTVAMMCKEAGQLHLFDGAGREGEVVAMANLVPYSEPPLLPLRRRHLPRAQDLDRDGVQPAAAAALPVLGRERRLLAGPQDGVLLRPSHRSHRQALGGPAALDRPRHHRAAAR